MKTFAALLGYIALGVCGIGLLIAFMAWDESERDQGYVQLMEYDLYYTYKDGVEPQDYRDGNGWYAELFWVDANGRTELCDKATIGVYDYAVLAKLSDLAHEKNKTATAPAWVFQRKTSNKPTCQVALDQWPEAAKKQILSTEQVVKLNTIYKAKKEVQRYLEAVNAAKASK
ncbi:hypothetical protein [Bowmanella sp. JS7-9]|uniref:Uncharacterized protein n=1 Tax=Pseudobowmanella zhangzhouensis TaxID=1537679 RepID=A0ABW1XKA0_9ALTE|nr:hypothetical protein [Bowmanella sp. JS7-9]